VESYDLQNPFVCHTLRLIQHNWVVLAYNFNIVKYMCNFCLPFITVLSLLLPCIIILFLHLLSTNHKCAQPCYFHPVTQTSCSEGEDGLESLTMSSRLRVAPIIIPVELWSLMLFRSIEGHHSLQRHYLCNNYTLFVTFGYL
jgi:hypothetical protein